MYEELMANLRNCVSDTGDCTGCPYQNGYKGTYCMNGLIIEAANAIEELNRKVEDFESMREISPEAEYAINKHTDNLISKLDELINSPNTDNLLKENETLKKELAQYKAVEEKGYIITPPESGLKAYFIDKTGEMIKGNISKIGNIKDFLFDYAISIDNTTM